MYKVLIVEDEDIIRKGLMFMVNWQQAGCVVAGEAADGLEMLEKSIREYGYDAIIVSGYSEFEYARNALKLLAFDYLLKPFEDGELEDAVSRVRDKLVREREEKERREESKILSPGARTGDKSRYIKEAIAYITEHYNDSDLSVGTIAESLGISEGHLSHLFKKETDYTVMAYITRCRIREAMKLLTNCRYKVYEVGEMVGYRDITYFSSTFKKIAGVTPSEYQAANS